MVGHQTKSFVLQENRFELVSLSSNTIDRIVANVLNQLGSTSAAPQSAVPVPAQVVDAVVIEERIITAELIERYPAGQQLQIPEKAIITPAARDVVRDRQFQIVKSVAGSKAPAKSSPSRTTAYIVHHSEALERALSEMGIRTDLLGCPDDAAKDAISDICRGDADTVMIFAEQVHRAACFANRNEKVKAVTVRDGGDVKEVRKQLRANTWCINPSDLSYFQIRNLVRAIGDSQ